MPCSFPMCRNYFRKREDAPASSPSPTSTDLKTSDIAKAILIGAFLGFLVGACVTGPLFSLPILAILYLAGVSTEAICITGIAIVTLGALYSGYIGAKEKLKRAQEEVVKIN